MLESIAVSLGECMVAILVLNAAIFDQTSIPNLILFDETPLLYVPKIALHQSLDSDKCHKASKQETNGSESNSESN